MRTVAVVLAAGSGQRFGGGLPKQLRTLAGRTLIEHSVSAFHEASGIDAILVVTSPELIGRVGRLVRDGRFGKVSAVIEGGVTRTGSTRRAIAALGEDDCDVLFHDAARPLIDQQTIAACVDALATDRAIGVTVPSSDTIVEAVDGMVTRMPIRDLLLRCQTPQGFRLSVIAAAYRLAAADPAFSESAATDDCGVVLRYLPDVPIRAVPGSERNIKITYPIDLDVAELLLRT
ncbi:MAG TPA: IspD/TarI family cytidylyltransferase [Streptosporangiaceae bacterium]|nr:IspD/TarI family cytidylyltransferase [Streptosporangiaceae bacterium]